MKAVEELQAHRTIIIGSCPRLALLLFFPHAFLHQHESNQPETQRNLRPDGKLERKNFSLPRHRHHHFFLSKKESEEFRRDNPGVLESRLVDRWRAIPQEYGNHGCKRAWRRSHDGAWWVGRTPKFMRPRGQLQCLVMPLILF